MPFVPPLLFAQCCHKLARRGAPAVISHWKHYFDDDAAFHRKTAAIYDCVNTEPRLLANDLLFAALDRRVAPGDAMLDLGCGTGQMLLRYGACFRRAVGVDHSREMLAIARERVPGVADGRCTLVESEFFAFLAASTDRFSLISCVGCLHHLPVEAFAEFFPAVRAHLHAGGQLLLAEPVVTANREPPPAVAHWNARSVMASRATLMPMEESAEAPIPDTVLLDLPGASGFRRIAVARGWELFQHRVPAGVLDRVAMRYLHARYGGDGNIVAALWQAV
jgi:SAM-dependent methyltransferase